MAWNLSLADLMNAMANSAASALRVELAVCSAGAIPISAPNMIEVDIYPAETIGVSCSNGLPVSAADVAAWPVCGHGGGGVVVSGEMGLDPYDSIAAGITSAVAASTAYQLPSNASYSVGLHADDDNSGAIFIGGSGVLANGTNGYRLNAGQSLALRLSNTNIVYFCAPNADDSIYWIVIA